ncbi:DUF4232 domain-containing protein [Streptosporangium amethystogenes]|uniref:DUF4232 domain-containing protein n=1 Tax=Streptosporangium amethystogenes TaxID=2002 RepID=UPI00068E7FBD|nr:DUF4232 domain-containing protein [Streptosporangium amethystogenes]
MKQSIGTGLLVATSALAMLAATTACAPPAARPRGAVPAAGGAPASFSPARDSAPASSSPSSAPARPAVAVQAAGLRVAGGGTAAGRCRTEALAARVGRVDAGAGQRYAPLVFTNTSTRTCWVYGFVGLIMIDGSGDAMRTRTRRESLQPRRITLRPGASAHARLHWSEVPGGSRPCPASARLMIIPPDEVAHLEIPFKAAVCDDGRLDATPLASGARL